MARREETEQERRRRIGILNARLPKKRNIAQGLLRNPAGEVLLCELSYKAEWDLPGGVVDPGEPPALTVTREIEEELGLRLPAGPLVAVNWLPPWRGWDDAHLFLFDLGVFEGELDPSLFLPREIAGAHWVRPEAAAEYVAPYTARMLEIVAQAPAGGTLYLENSELPSG
ncbi:NUDIX hydrolase [Nostocoides sp. Soil756]|jgi:8-oxo-dGTP pyrophosphatase MutT (NUDIX family)|uniref:NUDIX domain-containing protein n=1 Tax=Nostocoides sp. Soil756 TaxID=1736399 RepID=UPI0006FD937D|nr:NUDIX hydrolase [Tetrasphaera sp. Soil756]KRE61120.1 pyrophosphohydrolase [Tetrasphaera sp. Soil756]